MFLVQHNPSFFCGLGVFANAFDFVDYYSVFVDCGAQEKVCGLLFYQEVSIRSDLVKAERGANPEDGFPGIRPSDVHVEFICELHPVRVLVVLGVEEHVAARLFSQFLHCVDIFELSLAVRKSKQIHRDLPVGKLRGCVAQRWVA